jgi:hypothetical protein
VAALSVPGWKPGRRFEVWVSAKASKGELEGLMLSALAPGCAAGPRGCTLAAAGLGPATG